MDHFQYRNGELYCEEVSVTEIADALGTPIYVYTRQTLLDHYHRLKEGFAELTPSICYSVKSCHNLHILRLLAGEGSGFDVVSGGELRRVMEIGAPPSKVVFAGVGKTDEEIRYAMDCGIGWFNAESEAELDRLDELAAAAGRPIRTALRVNPDVDPQTHRYTTTGKKETKFGVDVERARRIFADFGRRRHLNLTGLHLHIGSPVNRIEPYVESTTKAVRLADELRTDGFAVNTLNLGGGFGAHYQGSEAPPARAYAEQIVPLLRGKGLTLLLEPGRSISANAGILVGRTIYTKRSGDRHFVITDAAMTELLRPALYDAYHFVWPVRPAGGYVPPHRGPDLRPAGAILTDVVGPVCESGDFLAKDRHLPPVQRGDLLAVFTTGAYGSVMSSHYNSRPRAAEVLVEGDTYRLIRRRETYDDLVAAERV